MSVRTSDMKLPPQGVVVVWEWEWDDADSDVDHVSESSCECENTNDHDNPHLKSESESGSEEETNLPLQSHTVTFKCIGATHDVNAQEALCKAAQLLQNGDVPVMIVPEPENQFDSRAIAFKCQIKDKWHRIGYVVREALDDVHRALQEKKITNVTFAWVKYLVVWMRSGPGFYAGVNITIRGEWSVVVRRCASTR